MQKHLCGAHTPDLPGLVESTWGLAIADRLRSTSLSSCSLSGLLLFSCSVMFDSLQPHGLKASLSITNSYSKSCPLSQWCHPTISASVVPFSCLHSFPASGSFLISQLLYLDNFMQISYHHRISLSSSFKQIPLRNEITYAQLRAWNNRQQMMTHLFFLPSYAFLARLHPTRKVIVKRERNRVKREPASASSSGALRDLCSLLWLFSANVGNFEELLRCKNSF